MPNGFMTYYGGPADGKHARMVEQLVISIHEFSKMPVVVAHFGFGVPASWTAERFPRMVLIHYSGIEPEAPNNYARSFNFNKLRAMMLAKIKVGVQLDADQFVAPGVDNMFASTAREITKEYPRIIMPAHFLDRAPRDGGAWWKRYCPNDDCSRYQTQRWGHAHPTWSYWALPHIGRWLRRNFRDESLPERKREDGGVMVELRITDIPEDEDLMNVGIWEEGGTKQWCKIDQVDPSDFASRLGSFENNMCSSYHCGDVSSDRKWHPNGVPKVFYEAHHAVNPVNTANYIKRIKEAVASGKLAPPILYHKKFYEDGDALRAVHPKLTCII